VPGTFSTNNQQVARYLLLPTDSADGYNLTAGYAILPTWEVFARYDRLNRGTDTATNERRFETWSLSTRYYFTKSVYAVGSYEWRDFKAPRLADNAVPNTSLDTVDDRLAVRLYWTFF
jgi:predicted porin